MKKIIFVYGTLKLSRHNSYLLKNARLLCSHMTHPKFTMYSMGGYPAVTASGTTRIEGELYEVNDIETLNRVYALERYTGKRNHPNNWYNTTVINTPFGEAEMFIFDNPPNKPIVEGGKW